MTGMQLQDQLYAWVSTLPLWQQELFLRALTISALDEDALDEMLSMLLGDQKALQAARTVQREDLPADLAAGVSMQLLSIEHREGVNRLPPRERADLVPDGINALYGHNGAGKSGWARIPKHAGRALNQAAILGDVFTPEAERPAPTAVIRWQLGGAERRVDLALDEPAPADLAGMCVFDGTGAEELLTSDHEVDYVPLALGAVQRLARLQSQLAAHVRSWTEGLTDEPLDLRPYGESTDVARRLRELGPDTDLEALRRMAALDAGADRRREELAEQLAALDRRTTRALADAADREATAIDELAAALRKTAPHVDEAAVDGAANERRAVAAAEQVVAGMSAERFASEPLSGVATEPWVVMWRAAQRYMHEANGQPFPPDHDDATCPLCMQQLDEPARDRLRRFDEALRSDAERQLADARRAIDTRCAALPDVERLRGVHGAAVAAVETADADAGGRLSTWFGAAALMAAAVRAGADAQPAPSAPLSRLEELAAARRAAAAEHRRLDHPDQERLLRAELAELQARAQLRDELADVERRVGRAQRRARIAATAPKLATGPVSTKLRGFAEGFVTGELQTELQKQLRALNFHDVDVVRCNTSGREGTPRVGLKIRAKGNVPLRAVLSDGEQRRLALAFFLAEATVAYPGRPLVLDDPVCSVDHLGRRHIAMTLAKLARERQVNVFTHELAFLHELQVATTALGVHLHTLHITRSGGRPGHVQRDLPWEGRTLSQRAKELNNLHQALAKVHRDDPDDPAYTGLARDFATRLRQTFERAIEEDVLGGTVTRGDAGVHPQALSRVAWSEEVCALADRGVALTSPWLHDAARTLNPAPPTPDELKESLDVLHDLRAEAQAIVKARKDAAKVAAPTPGEADAPPGTQDGDLRQLPGLERGAA